MDAKFWLSNDSPIGGRHARGAVDSNGRLLAFSVLADQTTNSGQAEAALDRITAAVAGCGCS